MGSTLQAAETQAAAQDISSSFDIAGVFNGPR